MGKVPTGEMIGSVFGDLRMFEVSSEKPVDLLVLGDNSLEALKAFVDGMSIPAVFVERKYLTLDDLLIKGEHYMGISLELLGGVQFDSHIFNRDIGNVDLSDPIELTLFALYEGKAFGVHYVDSDLDDLRRISPAERVSMFVDARREKLRSQTRLVAMKNDPVVERFIELLVHDHMYKNLRDENDRFNYVIKISRRPGNDELRKCICKEDGKFSTEAVRKVMNLSWARIEPVKGSEHQQMVFDKV